MNPAKSDFGIQIRKRATNYVRSGLIGPVDSLIAKDCALPLARTPAGRTIPARRTAAIPLSSPAHRWVIGTFARSRAAVVSGWQRPGGPHALLAVAGKVAEAVAVELGIEALA